MKKIWIIIVLLFILSPVGAQDSSEETTQVPPYGAYMSVLTCTEEQAHDKLPSEWLDEANEWFNGSFEESTDSFTNEDALVKAVFAASCAARLRPYHWQPWAELSNPMYFLTGDMELSIDLKVLAYDLGWNKVVSNLPTRNRTFFRANFYEDHMKRAELFTQALEEVKAQNAPREEIAGVYKELTNELTIQGSYDEALETLEDARAYFRQVDYWYQRGWILFRQSGANISGEGYENLSILSDAFMAFLSAGDLGNVNGYLIPAQFMTDNPIDWDAEGLPGLAAGQYLGHAAGILCPQLKVFEELAEARGSLRDPIQAQYFTYLRSGECEVETPTLEEAMAKLPTDERSDEAQAYKLGVARRLILSHVGLPEYDGNDPLNMAQQYVFESLNQSYLGTLYNILSQQEDKTEVAQVAWNYYEESFNIQNALWTRRMADQREELDAPFIHPTSTPTQ